MKKIITKPIMATLFFFVAFFSVNILKAQWSELGGVNALNANGSIKAMCKDAAGNIYVAGSFTNTNGKRYVAKYNGTNWNELGGINALAANFDIAALYADAQGNIYAGGGFTNNAGRCYVAKFNGTSWSELGGANSMGLVNYTTIRSICGDAQGNIYVTGDFLDANNHFYVAKFSGGSWSKLGNNDPLFNAFDDIFYACTDGAGNLYAACTRQLTGYTFIAKYNGSSWIELGGPNSLSTYQFDFFSSIACDAAGNVYAVGYFLDVNFTGVSYMPKWNGTNWVSMLTWSGGEMHSACFDQTGNVYAGGTLGNCSAGGQNFVMAWPHSNNVDTITGDELGGHNSMGICDGINAMISDAQGNIYAAGDFKNGSGKYYVAKFNNPNACVPTTSTTNLSVPSNQLPYSWNGLTFTTTGSQTAHLTNSKGCDSAATLNLTIALGANSLQFDGVNDYVSTSKLISNPQNFTISTWFKTSSTTAGHLVGFAERQTGNTSSGSADRVISIDASGKLQFYIYNTTGNVISSPLSYNDGKYHHVAASISSTNGMSLYVDGALVASNASVTTAQNYNGYWRMNNVGNVFLNVTLDQVKIYGAALNVAEVQNDMFDTSRNAFNLLYYYNFDKGIAGGNNAGLNIMSNLSSTVNNATLQNFALNGNTSNWVEGYAMVVPTATAATNVTSTSFTANWLTPIYVGVDNYFLDVSTNPSFSSFVNGYNGLSVIGTSQNVIGLSQGNVYYYRVRANKNSVANQGNYSNTITTTAANSCSPTASTIYLSICSAALPYSWNGLTFNAAGSKTAHLTNAGGCDSAATLNLTVINNPSTGQLYSKYGYATSVVACTLDSFRVYPDVKGGVWSSADSSIVSTIKQPGVTSTIVLKPQSAGSVMVRYTVGNTGSGNCPDVLSMLVTVAPQATPAAISGASTICVGSTATYTSASTGGVWSVMGRATINASGVLSTTLAGSTTVKYTLTNANGCSASTSYNVTVNPLPSVPTISFTPGTTGITGSGGYCKNKTFTLIGTPSGGTFSATGTFSITSGGVTTTANTTGGGSVTYTYTNSNGCSNSRTIPANVVSCGPRGVSNQVAVSNEQLVVYPNPAHLTINLSVKTLTGSGSIVVTDLYGKTIKQQALSMGTNTIDVSSFAKGMYLVSMITEQGKQTQKVIVE